MKVILISPPVSNIGQASPSISVLSAWLLSRGHECLQWDLGLEAFHHYHSRDYLERAARRLEDRGEVGPRERALTGETAAEIEKAKAALKRPGVESDLGAMSGALETIRRAGLLISAAESFSSLSYSRFELPGAFAGWESLREAVADRERNLLLDFFDSHAIPRIEQFSPRLVAISVSYQSQLLPAFSLTRAVKDALPEISVLLGGSFLKSVQDDLLHMPASVVPADGICIGDGEPTLESYLEALQEGHRPDQAPNLLLPKGDRFTFNGEWQQLDLEQAPVPMMQMHGLDLGSYLVPRYAIPLPVTRGCHWHRCVYCNISNQARESYRSRSAEACVADIKALVARCDTNWFDFPTDSILPRDLEQLARRLIDERVDIRWAAEVLPDRRLTDEIIALLGQSGCCCLRFGLESACLRTLKSMNKSVVDPREVERILTACRRHGIMTGVMLIVGFPNETQSELMQSVEYLRQNHDKIDFLTLHQFTIAPGSRLAAQPELAGVHLLPRQGVLTPSLPYTHTNPVAMRPEDLPRVVDTLIDSFEDIFPQCHQLWASGIGGWLTFAASTANGPGFFKQPLP